MIHIQGYNSLTDEFHKIAPGGWLDALELSERQASAGVTVPYAEVKRGLQESIARLASSNNTAETRSK